jgi:L,D-transpeptidase ErfK/SrfK
MQNHIEHGQPIEKVRAPGPDNPLGDYAMNLGFKNIVLHGTNTPRGVGVRSSHGCIRMLPEDIEILFHQVKVGTSVRIIHEPTKIGRIDDQLFIEAHVPISKGGAYAPQTDIGATIEKLAHQVGANYEVQWDRLRKFQSRANGVPLPIGSIFP